MKNHIIYVLIASVSILFFSCQETDIKLEQEFINESSTDLKTVKAKRSTNTILFDLANQDILNENNAEVIFRNQLSGWDNGYTSIQNDKLKVILPQNHHLSNNNSDPFDDGLRCRIDVPERDGYQLEFDVIFQSNFSFAGGGKVGFGFAVGEGVTGGNTAAIEAMRGGSFRVIWDQQNENHYLCPYIYYQDMTGQYGNDFIDHRFLLEARKRYTIRLKIKSNTAGNRADGYGKMEISTNYGRTFITVWEKDDIRWSGNETASFRHIDTFYFQNFRGGRGTQYDGENGDQGIYFDNLRWKPL